MTSKRLFHSAILLGAATAFGTAAGAQEPTRPGTPPATPKPADAPAASNASKELTLRIAPETTYAFMVTCAGSSVPARPAEAKPPVPKNRDEKNPAGTPSEGIPPAADSDAARQNDIRVTYGLRASAAGEGGDRKVMVMIEPSDALVQPDRAEKKGDAEAPSSTVTLTLDSQNRVKSIDGLEQLRSSIRVGDSGLGTAFAEHVRTHLALIVGSGLHGTPLEAGKTYAIAGIGKIDAAKNVAKDEKSAKPAGDVARGGAGATGDLCEKQLRFDGVSGNEARFTIVESSSAADRALGQATYSVNDGLITRLNCLVDAPADKKAGTPSNAAAGSVRVTIERLGGDVTEPPR